MEDRNLSPGLRFPPLDTSRCRQLTEHFAQSTAVHSRSKGWLPMIKLDLHHRPLIGSGKTEVLELIIRPEDLKPITISYKCSDGSCRRGCKKRYCGGTK